MKQFFNKAKLELKFSRAGPGHALSEEKPPPKAPPSSSKPAVRHPPSDSSHTAGSAAIARLEDKQASRPRKKTGTAAPGPPPATHKHLPEAAMPISTSSATPPQPELVDVASHNVIVHVICPVCQHSIPSRAYLQHLTGCLQEEYLKEPLSSSAQMIHSLCGDTERRKVCVDTVSRYLDNVIDHPSEDKYHKIRVNNKAFQERVCAVLGATLFLEAVGFQQQLLPHQDGEEQFLVLSSDKALHVEELTAYKELLISTEPLSARVDRNLQVLRPSSSSRATHFDLPREFFHLSVDEIKREHRQRAEAVEQESMLRTRAMRERDETRMAIRHYRYVLIRVRLPDGLLLQAVFRPMEKLSAVRLLVSEALCDACTIFSLSSVGRPLQEDDLSLAQLGLAPSSLLNLTLEEVGHSHSLLRPDLLARVQEL